MVRNLKEEYGSLNKNEAFIKKDKGQENNFGYASATALASAEKEQKP